MGSCAENRPSTRYTGAGPTQKIPPAPGIGSTCAKQDLHLRQRSLFSCQFIAPYPKNAKMAQKKSHAGQRLSMKNDDD